MQQTQLSRSCHLRSERISPISMPLQGWICWKWFSMRKYATFQYFVINVIVDIHLLACRKRENNF